MGATRVAAGDVSAPAGLGFGVLATNAIVDRTAFSADSFTAMDNSQYNANATDLIVTAGAISGGYTGIYADNSGIGATVIRATGSVSGFFGIYAHNQSQRYAEPGGRSRQCHQRGL